MELARLFKLLLGPILFFAGAAIGGFDNDQALMIGIMLWMLSWWITEVVPLAVTALLPMILFPMAGILELRETTINYANPVIYLFFGGFVLGLAIEKWGLHKRIALNIMNLAGEKPSRVILGCMLATSLLSMWISNTATTVMMLPIGMSVVALLKDKIDDGAGAKNFALTLMLGIAYAANIGGITTLIGTPPNLVLASIVDETGLDPLGFSEWLFFAFPLVIILFTAVYLINTKLVFPVRIKKLEGISELISGELKGLGKIGKSERNVLMILVVTALLWIFRAQLTKIIWLEGLNDTIIAIFASIMLFIWPSEKKSTPILVWSDTKKLPWDILLLFGGGISLAKGLEITNVVGILGDWISTTVAPNPLLVILVVCAFAVFLTEVMSNVALVAVFIPVSFVIAQNFGFSELQLAIPLTIGASCAFMFPISTPPNAIVFSSGYINMNQMARVGIILNITCILIITLYSYFFQGLFF
ncbi:MAG: DASS family sodium-coupled anion symporter [Balneolaceae bacterium]|nr:DASS family sodium-coupled anion symporter [Balneolaceae bacterium]MBO6545942.1 DASS family sodium-coupled anion symporter [Balneolaceae bacterium]